MTVSFLVHIRDARFNRTLCKRRAPLACEKDLTLVTCPRCLKRRASQLIHINREGK